MNFKIYAWSGAAFALLFLPASYAATVTCFCEAFTVIPPITQRRSVHDLTPDLGGLTFAGMNPAYNAGHNDECKSKCCNVAINNQQQIANDACSRSVADGEYVMMNFKLGTRNFQEACHRKLVNKPATPHKDWVCPSTWLSNSSNQPNGITSDGKCKKLSGTYTGPLFPNGTQFAGNTAFTWGNEIWVYGTAANGGAASLVVAPLVYDPAICKLQ